MKKNKTSQLLLLMAIVSLILTGCGRSAANNTKTGKLALTKENVQKVFQKAFGDEYELLDVSVYEPIKSISVGLISEKDIPKNKGSEKLKEVENILHKNFDIGDRNSIEIVNDNKNGSHRITVIKEYIGKIIQIGQKPNFTISDPQNIKILKYSMSTKFNLLNPYKNITLIAKDEEDGDITSKVKLKNPEVLNKLGEQSLIYEVTDSDNNTVTENYYKIEVTK